MAIEDRSVAWRLGQSWYILLTLPFGITSWLAFLYLGLRAGRGRWLLSAGVYFAVLVVLLMQDGVPGPGGEETLPDWVGAALLGMWFVSLVHALVARRPFLEILDARAAGRMDYASAPAADPYAALRDPAEVAAASRGDFALFQQRTQQMEPAPAVASPPPLPVTPPPLPVVPPPIPQAEAAPPPPPPAPRRPGRQVDF